MRAGKDNSVWEIGAEEQDVKLHFISIVYGHRPPIIFMLMIVSLLFLEILFLPLFFGFCMPIFDKFLV